MTITFQYIPVSYSSNIHVREGFASAAAPPFRIFQKTCTDGSKTEKAIVGVRGSIKGKTFPSAYEENRNGKVWKCTVLVPLLPANVLSVSDLSNIRQVLYNPVK